MSVTLKHVKAEHKKLGALIATLEAAAASQASASVYRIAEATIDLASGERYAGMVLRADGTPSHHLVLLPGQADSVNWDDAKRWAAEAGGELPTRQEQALLYANLKGSFAAAWYWSGEEHTDGSYAWTQYFSYGYQGYYHKSYEGRARAVRRLDA